MRKGLFDIHTCKDCATVEARRSFVWFDKYVRLILSQDAGIQNLLQWLGIRLNMSKTCHRAGRIIKSKLKMDACALRM